MPSSWLAVVAGWVLLSVVGCGESPGPNGTGSIQVNTQTTILSEPGDPDGYQVTVDGVPVATVPQSGQVTIASQPLGARSVRLTGVADNCAVGGDNPRIVGVEPDTTISVTFGVTCGTNFGSVRLQIMTLGEDIDPDGYTIVVSNVPGRQAAVASNGEVEIDFLSGQNTLQIDGIAPNCILVGPRQQDVFVPPAGQVDAQFELTCIGPLPYDLIFDARTGSSITPADIYRVNASGLRLTNLTASDVNEGLPNWSHDATRVVFNRSDDSLFVMQVDGTGVTDLGMAAFQADWSPDDSKFAAVVDRNIVLLNSDGSGLTQLTGVTCEHFVDTCSRLRTPDWSPDGSRILYYAGGGLFASKGCDVINVDGTGATRLNASCTDPTWSPDGSRIAYDFNGHIMVMDADGGNIVDLSLVTDPFTPTPGVTEQLPAWSPDGARIAFVSTRPIPEELNGAGGPHVFVMNADGTGVRQVTIGPDFVEVGRPAWGPAAP